MSKEIRSSSLGIQGWSELQMVRVGADIVKSGKQIAKSKGKATTKSTSSKKSSNKANAEAKEVEKHAKEIVALSLQSSTELSNYRAKLEKSPVMMAWCKTALDDATKANDEITNALDGLERFPDELKAYAVAGFSGLRKKYGEDVFLKNMKTYVSTAKPLVDKLANMVRRMQKMEYAANEEDASSMASTSTKRPRKSKKDAMVSSS